MANSNTRTQATYVASREDINPSAKKVADLVSGHHYMCMLSNKKVIFVRKKILGFIPVKYIVWFDSETRRYRRSRVEDNQLRAYSSMENR